MNKTQLNAQIDDLLAGEPTDEIRSAPQADEYLRFLYELREFAETHSSPRLDKAERRILSLINQWRNVLRIRAEVAAERERKELNNAIPSIKRG